MTVAANETQTPPMSREIQEWNSEVSEAMEIEGYSQIGGKENERTLDSLIGIPFLIKNATFRMGDVTPKGHKAPRDYVSLECLIHPSYAGRFNRKYIIFNDGSTGIYRQVMAASVARGFLGVPDDLPEDGEAHETRYDVSPTMGSKDREPVEFSGLKLLCPEGLRKSTYKNPSGGGDATTYYLA